MPLAISVQLFHVASPAIGAAAHLTSGSGPRWIRHLHSLCGLAPLFDALLQEEADNEQEVLNWAYGESGQDAGFPTTARRSLSWRCQEQSPTVVESRWFASTSRETRIKTQSLVHYKWREQEDPWKLLIVLNTVWLFSVTFSPCQN